MHERCHYIEGTQAVLSRAHSHPREISKIGMLQHPLLQLLKHASRVIHLVLSDDSRAHCQVF